MGEVKLCYSTIQIIAFQVVFGRSWDVPEMLWAASKWPEMVCEASKWFERFRNGQTWWPDMIWEAFQMARISESRTDVMDKCFLLKCVL